LLCHPTIATGRAGGSVALFGIVDDHADTAGGAAFVGVVAEED
jgi:hypothetical protein